MKSAIKYALGAVAIAILPSLIISSIIMDGQCSVFLGGCWGTSPQRTVQLNSATLYGGSLPTNPTCSSTNSAYTTLPLNNPGPATNISSITLSGSSLPAAVVPVGANYVRVATGACTSITATTQPGVTAGAVTTLNIYFQSGSTSTAGTLTTGQTFNYVISFVNGQSISGSLQAQ